jgi:hypothetical protein
MQKPISTKAHGILDYMTAGLLATLPRALGWDDKVTHLLDAAAAGTVVYSLLTRYEMGAVKALPMKAHLSMDAVQGGALIGAAAFLEDVDPDVRATLAALGMFELGGDAAVADAARHRKRRVAAIPQRCIDAAGPLRLEHVRSRRSRARAACVAM